MKYLFLNNENIDVCLPPYLRINMTIWLKKNKYQILTYHVNNTYSKLAPDSILNKQIKEIMCNTGDTGHPLFITFFFQKCILNVHGLALSKLSVSRKTV